MNMSAHPSDVKQVVQDQIRNKAVTKQINSPYAKYNSRGQLMCIVCGMIVKSAIIWQAHVKKRSHLENLTQLKESQAKLNSLPYRNNNLHTKPSSEPVKSEDGSNKRQKTCSDSVKPKGILKKISSYSSSSEDSEEEDDKSIVLSSVSDLSKVKVEKDTESELPQDFFDTEVKPSRIPDASAVKTEVKLETEVPPKPNTSEALPEGFFDDPVADAKARKVEYRDKEAEEWMAFMREVSAAEVESRQIIEEDKEEAALETQIEQASEQIRCLERIVELDKRKQEQLQEKRNANQQLEEEVSSDEEFAPVIWRTKNSLI